MDENRALIGKYGLSETEAHLLVQLQALHLNGVSARILADRAEGDGDSHEKHEMELELRAAHSEFDALLQTAPKNVKEALIEWFRNELARRG